MQQFGRDRVESGHRADIADIIDWSKMTPNGHSRFATDGRDILSPICRKLLYAHTA
jgi:hypothetical protein